MRLQTYSYLPIHKAGTKLYCSVTEAHVCLQLPQGCTQQRGSWDSNLQAIDCKSGAIHYVRDAENQ